MGGFIRGIVDTPASNALQTTCSHEISEIGLNCAQSGQELALFTTVVVFSFGYYASYIKTTVETRHSGYHDMNFWNCPHETNFIDRQPSIECAQR